MGDWKDSLRVSLGIIQSQNGNHPWLVKLTDLAVNSYMKRAPATSEIWTRNSYFFDSHIPLLSDVDFTLISSSTEDSRLLYRLRSKYLLLGEINFYHTSVLEPLLKLANPYELARDPRLLQKSRMTLAPSVIQRDAFLVRQIVGDQKRLLSYPALRVLKWRYLCQILSLDFPQRLNLQSVMALLSGPDIREHTRRFLSDGQSTSNIYEAGKTAGWKYLFPHFHIWDLALSRDQRYLEELSGPQKEMMLEQIKWEFWGIGCHHYWLNTDIAVAHLYRLFEVSRRLRPSSETMDSMTAVLDFIKREANRARK